MDQKPSSKEIFISADDAVQKIIIKAVELERSKRGGEGKNPKSELLKHIKEIVS